MIGFLKSPKKFYIFFKHIFSSLLLFFIASIIFLFLHFFRHIDQSEAIEHPIDVSHTPDVTQSLWSFNYFSYLFDIPQCQQHRTPRQAFALPSAVDPQFLCIFAASALSYFIDRKSTRLNSSHITRSRMPSSA